MRRSTIEIHGSWSKTLTRSPISSGIRARRSSATAALPWDIPVSDIASLVHAERAMTSRAVGRMVSSGLLERSGRTFVLKAVPPAARLWWGA